MLSGKRIAVVLPAYNAALTLEKTVADIPSEIVDDMLLVDDYSKDETVAVARRLGLKVFQHERNYGYGRNQKTCYVEALRLKADIVVMLHPDYQYEPRLVLPIAAMIASGTYDVVLGSRILGGTARSGGMPLYKYISNRFLTFAENLLVGAKLSEYHSGYRAFSESCALCRYSEFRRLYIR
jgi:glycosyltransferase involved in cell wall biosynthesis